jgi:multidrug efflux pump subunit AcrA (membrane-fusion protein)
VSEGDSVEASHLLVELEDGVLKSQVETAAAVLAEAEAARDKLVAKRPGADRAARADLSGAQAAAQARPTWSRLEAAATRNPR